MKSLNVELLLQIITNITNRSIGQTKELLFLLDGDINRLIRLEEKIRNNQISYCPADPKEVNKIERMSNDKKLLNIREELLNHLYSEDVRIFLKCNNKVNAKKEHKTKTQLFHQEYYKNYLPKEKVKIERKKRNTKSKRKEKEHIVLSKLVCIKNVDTNEIIRIRKDDVQKEVKIRNWVNWNFVTKSEFKQSKGLYKTKDYYNEKNEDGTPKHVYPVTDRLDKTVKINLAKAYYVPKDQKVELEDKYTVKTDPKGKAMFSEEKDIVIGRSYKKTKYITKVKGKMLPKEKSGRKIGKVNIEKGTKNKLVKERIYIPPKEGELNGKYITRKVLKEVVTAKVCKKEIVHIEKVQKYKKVTNKVVEVVKGKELITRIPILTIATKFITSLYTLAVNKYNDPKTKWDNKVITLKDGSKKIKKRPAILYLYSKSVKPF